MWDDKIVILTPRGVISYTNKSWRDAAAINLESPVPYVEGVNYLEICDRATDKYGEKTSLVASGIRDVINGARSDFEIEYTCNCPFKKTWYLLNVTPLSEKRPSHVLLRHTDITDQKDAELKLQDAVKKEDKHGIFFENMLQGAFIHNEGGSVLEVNPLLLEILGMSEEEFLLRDAYEPGWITKEDGSFLDVKEYPSFLALKKGEEVKNRVLRIHGHREDDHVLVSMDAFPLYGEQGAKASEVVVILRDINQREFAERTFPGDRTGGMPECDPSNETLKEPDDRFRSVLENIHLIGIMLDTSGELVFCNDFLLAVTGWKEHEILNRNWFDTFIPADIRYDVQKIFDHTVEGGEMPSYHENEIITKEGSRILIAWHNTVFRDNEGRITSVTSIGEDITDKREFEDEIRKFKTISDKANYGAAISDLQGNLLYVNDYFAEIHGYSTGELKGKSISMFHNAEQMEHVSKILDNLIEKDVFRNLEVWHTHRDGTEFPMLMSVMVMEDDRGEPAYFSATAIDITKQKIIEDELRTREEKFRALYDNAPLSYQSLDENGCFIDVNPTWLKTLGYEREEIIGKRYANLLHPESRSDFGKRFPEFKRRGCISDVRFRLRHKDGHYLYVSFEGCIGYNADGSFRQTYCVFKDITEQKLAEDELRIKDNRLKSIFRAVPAGIGVVRERVFTEVNDRICTMTGYSREELIGRNSRMLYPSEEEYKRAGREVYGQILTNISGIVESKWKCKDGKVIDLLITASPVDNKDPSQGVTFAVLDITERKRAEELLRASEEKYSTLVEKSNDGIIVVQDHLVCFANTMSTELVGYKEDGLIGTPLLELISDDYRELVNDRYERRIKNDQTIPNKYEIELLSRDGSSIPAEINASYVEYEGRPADLIIIRDIRERKQAELALKESESKFRSYIDNAPEGVFVSDENGIIIEVNRAASRITGYSGEELTGMHINELYSPEEYALALEKLEKVNKTGYAELEVQFLKKDGVKRWWRITAAKLSDNRVIGFTKDITARKNTEFDLVRALAHSQQKEKEITELLNATQSILEVDDFKTVARHIFDSCSRVIGAKSGYVALLSDSGTEEEQLFIGDGSMSCSADPEMPMHVRGLCYESYDSGKVVYDNDLKGCKWVKFIPEGHIPLKNVLLSPLKIEGKTMGIMAFSNKDGDFTDNDARLAKTFGEYAAIALRNIMNYDALEKSEERYRSIFETAPSLITSVDNNGVILDCNDQIRNFLGYDKEEIVGHKLFQIMHPDHVQEAFSCFQEVLDKGFSYNNEYQMLKKDGQFIDVLINSSGIERTTGSFERIICIINDITKRKQDENRIEYLTSILNSIRNVNQLIVQEKDPHKLLKGICDNLTENQGYYSAWICLFGKEQKITTVKESGLDDAFELLKLQMENGERPYCVKKVMGEEEIITIDDPKLDCGECPLINEYNDSVALVSKLEYDKKIYGVISTEIPVEFSEDEEVRGLFEEVVGDISFALYNLELESIRQDAERSLLEGKMAAEEANRVKSEFLANMSHELRTPLTAIIGFSDILGNNMFGELTEQQLSYVNHINNGGKHLLDIINDILDLSKIEAGKMELDCEVFSFPEVLSESRAAMSIMADKKSISLDFVNEMNEPDIFADRVKLKQIIFNLLSNAIKFTPENGSVSVVVTNENKYVKISVSDNGIGIPWNMQQEIFNPFRQADSSNKRKYGGTGLGLALVKRYVEMHDGRIFLESEVGKGSTFTVEIPMLI